jgi:hypothetical protein
MRLKTIIAKELAARTGKTLKQAEKGRVLVSRPGAKTLVLRTLSFDEIDEIIVQHPEFRASIRRARQNFNAGKGIPREEIRRRFSRSGGKSRAKSPQ